MLRDKNKWEQAFKQGEEYIINHPEDMGMTIEELGEHFHDSECEV